MSLCRQDYCSRLFTTSFLTFKGLQFKVPGSIGLVRINPCHFLSKSHKRQPKCWYRNKLCVKLESTLKTWKVTWKFPFPSLSKWGTFYADFLNGLNRVSGWYLHFSLTLNAVNLHKVIPSPSQQVTFECPDAFKFGLVSRDQYIIYRCSIQICELHVVLYLRKMQRLKWLKENSGLNKAAVC